MMYDRWYDIRISNGKYPTRSQYEAEERGSTTSTFVGPAFPSESN